MSCDYIDPESGATHEEIIDALAQTVQDLLEPRLKPFDLNGELMEALDKSVKLQAHYAELLNMHDGGERRIFKSSEEWIERLRQVKKETELLVKKQREQAE